MLWVLFEFPVQHPSFYVLYIYFINDCHLCFDRQRLSLKCHNKKNIYIYNIKKNVFLQKKTMLSQTTWIEMSCDVLYHVSGHWRLRRGQEGILKCQMGGAREGQQQADSLILSENVFPHLLCDGGFWEGKTILYDFSREHNERFIYFCKYFLNVLCQNNCIITVVKNIFYVYEKKTSTRN